MRKNTLVKKALIAVMFLLNIISYSQNLKPFTPRYDQDVRGDMFLIGNNILNRNTGGSDPEDSYNGSGYNSDFSMEYIDIDSDASTFSSSSANLASPRPGGDNCYKIVYAGLYWGAILQSGSRTDINKVKFKLPTGGYNDITGQIVYDAGPTPIGGDSNKPYACYADVTSLITPLANPVGTYTVANVLSSEGSNGGTGLSAGWSLIIVYEDPTLTSKSIVTFDGFSGIGGATTLDIPISGFRTIPSGPVRAKFAMTALEGDQPISGDYLRINGNTISTPERAANNFFNSSITTTAGYFTTRNPNSSNTLGYDAGILNVVNPGNAVIPNNATSATIRLGSTQDVYFYFFNAFAVDIIAPEIQLTKDVENALGVPIGGTNVNLGQQLNYEIGFQNIGNDNATSFTISDVLPINVIFNPADLALPGALPPGVTFTFTAPRTLTFTIPNNLVEVGDPRFIISIKVTVVSTCLELDDACSNLIQNQAFATYSGTFNTNVFSDEGSIAAFGACGFGTPGSTNFLVDLDDCDFTRTEVICSGSQLTLTAASGYDTYVWSGPGTITPVAGTNNQSVVINTPGTYTVNNNITLSPCKSIVETINVIGFGVGVTNPAIPVADQIVTCPTNNVQLPYIFLCGVGDSQLIQSNIAGAISISWEQLVVGSCPPVVNPNCANENPACTWNPVGTGPNYNVTAAGEYRVVITFQGNCKRIFYFNAYQNLLNPTVVPRDIICTTPGQITVNGVPPGYEYSLTGLPGSFVPSNIFTINTAGIYTVYIQQIGVTGGCLFTVPNVAIQARTMTVVANVTQPLCFGQKGSINLTANGVSPQYTFNIYQEPGHVLVNSVGPIASNNQVFSNLNPGNYSYQVTTQDGCIATGNFTINNPQLLTVTAALTVPLTCTNGEITIYPVGGTPPYAYFINSTTVFQTTPQYVVTAPGVYNIQVVDANNCTANTSLTVTAILPPAFNITKTDILCSGSGNTGSITVNVTNPNGNTLAYSINGAVGPFSPSPVFTNLAAGTYNVVVQYTVGPSVCLSTPQTITINPATAVTGTASLTTQYTCTTSGVITVTSASGGTAPYTYSNGGPFQPGNTFPVTAAGTVTITIMDANGCTFTIPVVVAPLNPPTDLSFASTALTCPANTSTVTVTATAANPIVTYQTIAPSTVIYPAQGSNVFPNVPPGSYTFLITDSKNCTYQETFTIAPLTPLTVVGQLVANVRCFGTSTGSIRFTVGGFAPNYNYTISGPVPSSATAQTEPVINITNLPVGTYTIVVTNPTTNCTATTSVTVNGPATALVAPVTVSPVTCATLGQVVVNASGGWGGYTYIMPSMPAGVTQSGATFSNIPAGSYTIITTDSGGCTVTTPFTLVNAAPPTASINLAASDFCYDGTNGASLVVTAAGGVAPYTFSIGGPFNPSNTLPSSYTFSNLTPGTYTITVMDAFGCTVTLPIQTIEPQLTVNASLTSPLNCTASPNAVISGTIAGGYSPYTCVVNGVTPVTVTAGNTFTYSASTAGTYQFTVTDSRGCIAQSSVVTVSALVPVSATSTVTNVTCNGLSNGSVTITPSGGTPGYQISFAGSPFTSTTAYTGLAAGTYNYIVRDIRSCTFNGSVTITQPTPVAGTASLTTLYTCTTNGVITVTSASGGTAPYTYSNGGAFQVGNTFPVTAPGTVTITIMDANGCTFTIPVVVAPLNPPTDLSFASTALTCPANTSTVTVTATAANPIVTYQTIAPSTVIYPAQGSNVFPNVPPGSYTFLITDSKNCTYQETFTIAPLTPLTVVGQLVANVRCFGTSTGSIRFTIGGFAPNYNYTISGPVPSSGTAQTAPVLNVTNLPAGTYTIVVTNPATNCTATTSVTINGPASALAAALTVSPLTCFGANTGQVVVNASGGWGGYTYTLTPPSGPVVGPSPSNTFSNLSLPGLYTVTTTDSGGCAVSSTFTLTTPVAPTASINVAASDFCYDTTNGATLVVTASGGVAPYTFSIGGPFDPSNTLPSSYTFSNLTPGSYTITVKDAFGCTVTLPVQTINAQLTISASLTKDLDCTASPNAVISGTIAGGYPIYTCLANINGAGFITPVPVTAGGTFTLSTAASGTYIFQVTDTRGCTAQTGVITINPLSLPVIASVVQTQQILCNGDSNAAINVNINTAVGNAPYVINVFNNTTGVNYGTQTSGLPAGNYTVTITDAKSCTDTEIIVIGQPALIAYTEVVAPITCSGSGTSFGSISVTGLTGGTAPFTYILTSNVSATQTFGPTPGVNHTFTVLNFGIYELSVVDANGCVVKKSNIIMSSPPTDLNIDISTPTASCAAGGTVVVTVSVFPPGGPYHFAIYQSPYPVFVPPGLPPYQPADVPGGLSSTFTGLTPGVTYSFVVYDETTQCYFFKEASGPIPTLSPLTSTIDVVNNVTCIGSADANVTFTYDTLDATSVTYQIFNSQTNTTVGAPGTVISAAGAPTTVSNIGPLAPGIYYITFTENDGSFTGCNNASATFTVTQSSVALSITASIIKNDNCNVNAGQISAVAQGGTAPYLYQIISSALAPPTASSPGWGATNNVLNAEGGSYIAYVMDAFGCIQSTPIILLPTDPSPVIAATTTNQCTATEGTFTINVTMTSPGIGPYTYSVDGSPFQPQTAPFLITGLLSGPHTIEVEDLNGCGNLVNVTILAPLAVSPAVTALPSCANNDGVITVSATGGSGVYTYSIAPNPAGIVLAGNVFSNVPSGSYTITVTDVTTTCTKDVPVVLGAATPVTFTTTVNNVSCNGSSDGIITVNLPASNDNPPYTYTITAGPAPAGPFPIGPQSSNVFPGLPSGVYTVVVTSGRGCSLTDATVTITQPAVLTASGSATAFTCAADNSVNTSTVTVNGAGGTLPYSYSIDGVNYFPTPNNTFNIIDTNVVQNLTGYVKDANGCIATVPIVVTPLPTMTSPLVTQNIAITCTNDELVTITVTGGSGNFSYQTVPVGAANVTQVGATNQFNISAPGTYYFQVNDLTTGCYIATLPYTVAPFNSINVVATATQAVTCFGDSNGAISINVTGYTGAYSYNVVDNTTAAVVASGVGNTSTNPLPITGLPAGNYTVQVTETASPFCIITSNLVTVASPSAPVALALISNINANCNSGAQVTVNGSGGTAPYTYAFVFDGAAVVPSDYSTSNTATLNLPQLLWDVYVMDANGCFTFIDVTIAADPVPTITVPVFAADQCTSTGASYTFTATGTGVPPLTYSIGTGSQSTGVFTVTTPGTYTVTVQDGNGCTASDDIIIYPVLGITPAVTALPSCANNDGVITVSATGGSGVYTYSIAPNPAGIVLAGNVFSNVPSGSYTITVTDVTTTCTKDVPVVLGAATPVTFTTTVNNVSCNGSSDGIITVNLPASNDNPPYTYTITAGPAPAGPFPIGPQSSNVFPGLPSGVYTVVVTSGRGCSLTDATVTITQPAVLTASGSATAFTCAADNSVNTSTVTVNGAGGTLPYSYSIDGVNYFPTPNNTFNVIDTNVVQNLTGYVKDANGCIATVPIVVTPLPTMTSPLVTQNIAITCTNDELVTITVTGGSGNFSYQTVPVGAANVTQVGATNQFNISAPGTYYFQVNDLTTGCYIATLPYTVAPFNSINVVATATQAVTCFGDSNGAISINVTGYTGAYSYNVVDNTTAAVVASGVGNTSTNPLPITGLPAGNYTVQVTETASPFCIITSNLVTVASPSAPLALNAQETANVTCTNDQGIITATATGGWGAYEFELVGPVNSAYSGTSVFTNLPAGSYTVNVRDLEGCIATANVTLVVPTPIAATFTATPTMLTCFGDTNACITVTNVTGGQGSNYTYTLNNGNPTVTSSGPQVSPIFCGLGAGIYTITIRDGYNCFLTSASIVIAQPAIVGASLTVASTQTCLTSTMLTLTASGGTPPYFYSSSPSGPFNNPFAGATTTPISVPVGTYSYYVQDSNGCMSAVSNDIQIDPLTPLTFSTPSHTDILCPGSTGSISIVATGGLLNYVYTLYNGFGVPIAPAPTQLTPGNFTNLPAGDYIVHVTSLDCTLDSGIITIAEPPTFTVVHTETNVKCFAADDGEINLVITGGTAPIQYAITPNLDQFITIPNAPGGYVITGLAAGSYHIIIRDQIHCNQDFDIIITEPAELLAGISNITNETCFEDNDGSVTISGITGGTAPYSVSYNLVNSPPGTPVVLAPGVTTHTFSNLDGGEYSIVVTDGNNCQITLGASIGIGVLYDPFVQVTFPCVDNAPAVRIEVFNLTNQPTLTFDPLADFMFSLDVNDINSAQASNVFTSADYPSLLTPGTHTVYVFNVNGCYKTAAPSPFTINASDVDPLTLVLSEGGLNEIIATSTGGSGGNTYTFNNHNNGSDNSYVYDASGTYVVTVTDSAGCSVTEAIPVVYTPIFIPNVFTPNGNGGNDSWGPTNTSNYKDLVTFIYDRYGRKVAELKEGQFWDGKYEDKELPSGDYWYVIKVDGSNDREYVGHFTLYR